MLSPSEIAAGYDQAAEGYDDRHRGRSQLKYRRIENSMRARIGQQGLVLDLGSGTGRLLREAPECRGVGIDISLKMLKFAPNHLALACADGHQLPFADRCFDTVLAAQGVIRYMEVAKIMQEVFRVLRPGGRFLAHQFGSVLTLRRLRRVSSPLDMQHPSELAKPALAAGFLTLDIELWRPVRAYPYAVRVPSWLPGRLWTHCVAVFARPS